MIKKLFLVLIIIFNIFILTGCWNVEEIEKMEIVSGIAIDKGKNGVKYNLAAELISSDKEAKVPSKVVESSANTLFESTRKMISTSSRKLYYGHCKSVIISEELAREGIAPVIDILMRFFSSRISLDLIIAKDVNAKEVLKQDPVRKLPNGFEIETLIKNNEKSLSYSKKAELYTVVNDLGTAGMCTTIPAIKVEKGKSKSKYKLDGLAVFSKDELVGFIDADKTKYYLFITDLIKGGTLSIKVDDKKNSYVAVQIIKNKTDMEYSIKDNKLSFNIHTETEVNISEMATDNKFSKDPQRKKLKSMLENKLEKNMKDLIAEVQNNFGCDIFGFGNKIHNTNPDLWKHYKKDWNETFETLDVNVKSEIKIINEGITNQEIKTGE